MASTADDLVKDVLLELSRIDAADDPDAVDSVYINRIWKMENAQLQKRHISYWNFNAIPDEVYNSCVLYVASLVGNKYGAAYTKADQEAAREVLATDAKPRFTGAKLKSDYPFGGVKRFDFSTGS
jgi:hypothetical protein